MRNLTFCASSWSEYKDLEKPQLKKADALITDIQRNGNIGIGHPEPLTGDKSGLWSRHIDDKNRIVYRVTEEEVFIYSLKGHYDDK
jgi:toxin YoeB